MSSGELDKLKDYVMFDQRIKDHIGLKNVYHRLKIYFKEALDFDINSHPDIGTTIELEIPMLKEAQR
jgi:two-component system sensor histidine kinase YesM